MDDRFYQSLIEIRRLCEEGTQAHGDEFYGPILNQVDRLEEAEGIDTKAPPVRHKMSSTGIVCGAAVPNGVGLVSYWDDVTCPVCLGMRPMDSVGRTSIKHSYRAESGPSFID